MLLITGAEILTDRRLARKTIIIILELRVWLDLRRFFFPEGNHLLHMQRTLVPMCLVFGVVPTATWANFL